LSAELNRLRWRCQRGMLELDHILRGFLERGYPGASAEVKSQFERLLALEDADILDLILGRTEPPAGLSAVLVLLRLDREI